MSELEHVVELETDRPAMPAFCCCCGAEATESHVPEPPGRMRGLPQPEEPLRFPYCAACKLHLRASQDRRTSNLVAVNIAVWGVAIPLAGRLPAITLIAGPAIGGFLFFNNKRRDLRASGNCTAEGPAARVTWHRKHTYRYAFTRKQTAEAFLELNR